jgi:hypothetical protein
MLQGEIGSNKRNNSQHERKGPRENAGRGRYLNDTEEIRLEEARLQRLDWMRWAYLSECAWVKCAKTRRQTARPGNTSPTIMPAPEPIAGAKTDWQESAIDASSSASRWRYGTRVCR